MKNLMRLCALLFVFSLFACNPDDTIIGPKGAEPTKITVSIVDPSNGNVQGSSTLERNSNGITANFKANGLKPGHAYTLWWVVWNYPEKCSTPNECSDPDFASADTVQVEVMYAAGQVIGSFGQGNFTSQLIEDDNSQTINHLFGLPEYGGLLDAEAAEVHLVLRSHGPTILGQVDDQIGSYLGGCVVDLGTFTGNIPDEPGECGDILAAVFKP